jgi:hypothetical protein
MGLAERFSQAAKVFFAVGKRGDETVMAEFENGKPKVNQVYRGINSARGFVCYQYSCACGGVTSISGGRFAYQENHPCCNCGRRFCISDWLKKDMQEHRAKEAKVEGRPVKTGAFTHDEETAAENRLPYRAVDGGQRTAPPPFIDPWDPKNGGSTGETGYNGSNPGPESFDDISGFNDPFNASFRRR